MDRREFLKAAALALSAGILGSVIGIKSYQDYFQNPTTTLGSDGNGTSSNYN